MLIFNRIYNKKVNAEDDVTQKVVSPSKKWGVARVCDWSCLVVKTC